MALSQAQGGFRISSLRPKSKLIYLLLALPLIGVLLFVTVQPVLVLPRIRLAPGYALVNQDGARVSQDHFLGQIVIYNVAYTNCQDECAESWALMASMQRELAQIETEFPVTLVTISVDPNDTPETLSRFAADYGIDLERWHLLTGDPEHLKYVVGAGFNTYYTYDSNGNLYLEPSVALVDGVGILRAVHRSLPSAATLVRDMDLLLVEARNSTGLTRYAYEAAHLFLCYP
jgi:protein SCO1